MSDKPISLADTSRSLDPTPVRPPRKNRGFVARAVSWSLNQPLWMLVPCLLALVVLIFIPVVATVYLSTLRLDVTTLQQWVTAPFIGFGNFVAALQPQTVLGVTALQSLGVSFAFSIVATIFVTPIGVLAAISVNRPFRGRGIVRSIYLIPYVIPTFAVALLARIMFLNHYGIIDQVLSALGIANLNTYWLIGPNAFWALTLTDVWATWPFIYLMVLAGLQTIPREQHEAALLDGASPLRKLFSIVIPQIRSLLFLAILLSTLNHFGNFTLAYVMFSSPPPGSAAVLPLSTYFYAFTSFNYGTASAIAVITMVVLIIPGYIYLRMTRITDGADKS